MGIALQHPFLFVISFRLVVENFVNCKFLYIAVVLEQVEINLFLRANNHNVVGLALNVLVEELGSIFKGEVLDCIINFLAVVVSIPRSLFAR